MGSNRLLLIAHQVRHVRHRNTTFKQHSGEGLPEAVRCERLRELPRCLEGVPDAAAPGVRHGLQPLRASEDEGAVAMLLDPCRQSIADRVWYPREDVVRSSVPGS